MRLFEPALKPDQLMGRQLNSDVRVLNMLADAIGRRLGLPDIRAARRELDELTPWTGDRPAAPAGHPMPLPHPATGQAVLAGWRLLLDNGSLQQGDEHLAGTRHRAAARLSPTTAAEIGASGRLRITGPSGSLLLPLDIDPEQPDRTVWLPLNSTDPGAYRALGTTVGHLVTIAPAGEGE